MAQKKRKVTRPRPNTSERISPRVLNKLVTWETLAYALATFGEELGVARDKSQVAAAMTMATLEVDKR